MRLENTALRQKTNTGMLELTPSGRVDESALDSDGIESFDKNRQTLEQKGAVVMVI